jgi:hypothetical protein
MAFLLLEMFLLGLFQRYGCCLIVKVSEEVAFVVAGSKTSCLLVSIHQVL